jgi:succinate dehydrogenase/fumarate reductase flavoprotein subunit
VLYPRKTRQRHQSDHYEKEVKATDSHTLMRVIETGDLMDCAEVLMLAALERKETSGSFRKISKNGSETPGQSRFSSSAT